MCTTSPFKFRFVFCTISTSFCEFLCDFVPTVAFFSSCRLLACFRPCVRCSIDRAARKRATQAKQEGKQNRFFSWRCRTPIFLNTSSLVIRVSASHACYCSSPTVGSNRSTTSPSVLSSELVWSPLTDNKSNFKFGILLAKSHSDPSQGECASGLWPLNSFLLCWAVVRPSCRVVATFVVLILTFQFGFFCNRQILLPRCCWCTVGVRHYTSWDIYTAGKMARRSQGKRQREHGHHAHWK